VPRVLLDFRVRRGGPGRYGHELTAALRALRDGRDVAVVERPFGADAAPFTPWGRLGVAAAAHSTKVDLVHGLHLEAPPLAGVPTVVTIPDVVAFEHPESIADRVRRLAYRRLIATSLRRAARIIVPSELTASTLVTHGADRHKLAVVPYGIGAGFAPSSEAERVVARARFAASRPYVAAAVTPRAHKNARGLARAAAKVIAKAPVAVLSTGTAPALGPLRFVGDLTDDDLRSFYAGAEVVVVPSHFEGFGLVVAEALACGVPAVCGPDVGALPYLRDGVVVADVSDPRALATEIGRLLGDDHLRRDLAEAGARAVRALTPEAMARGTLAVYEDALSRR
jgi:glycosyltransferase involved in cell wall biosynthesis